MCAEGLLNVCHFFNKAPNNGADRFFYILEPILFMFMLSISIVSIAFRVTVFTDNEIPFFDLSKNALAFVILFFISLVLLIFSMIWNEKRESREKNKKK